MEFKAPEPVVFANVLSLNVAFLRQLSSAAAGAHLRRGIPAALEPLLTGLTALQIQRLAQSPFLLFSLRELDDTYWTEVFSDDRNHDLFRPVSQPTREDEQLVAAALGFLWQLSFRNPYVARLVSGASLHWCERLSELPLLQVLQRVAGREDLLTLRLAENGNMWQKLLVAGISSEIEIRTAAQQCALQTVLTHTQAHSYRPMSAAACRATSPALQVADESQKRVTKKKL